MLLYIVLNQLGTSQVGAQKSVYHGQAQEDRHVPDSNFQILVDQTWLIRNPFSDSAIYRVNADSLLMIID